MKRLYFLMAGFQFCLILISSANALPARLVCSAFCVKEECDLVISVVATGASEAEAKQKLLTKCSSQRMKLTYTLWLWELPKAKSGGDAISCDTLE